MESSSLPSELQPLSLSLCNAVLWALLSNMSLRRQGCAPPWRCAVLPPMGWREQQPALSSDSLGFVQLPLCAGGSSLAQGPLPLPSWGLLKEPWKKLHRLVFSWWSTESLIRHSLCLYAVTPQHNGQHWSLQWVLLPANLSPTWRVKRRPWQWGHSNHKLISEE